MAVRYWKKCPFYFEVWLKKPHPWKKCVIRRTYPIQSNLKKNGIITWPCSLFHYIPLIICNLRVHDAFLTLSWDSSTLLCWEPLMITSTLRSTHKIDIAWERISISWLKYFSHNLRWGMVEPKCFRLYHQKLLSCVAQSYRLQICRISDWHLHVRDKIIIFVIVWTRFACFHAIC